MFKSARLKLTGWYLIIIMLISLFFSAVIYLGAVQELERGFHRAELRFKAEELGIPLPQPFSERPEDLPPRLREIALRFFSVEELKATKRRLGLNLLVVNGMILGISALASYFLAGRTLQPIEKVMEEQKRFVADASHELGTPLTAIKTSIEVALRDKKMSIKEAKKVLKENLEEVDSLHSLSKNLLSLAQPQKGTNNFVFEQIDIAEVIKSAYKKIAPLAKKKDINIKLKTASHILEADRRSLKEMVTIFLDNTVKYTPQGGKVTVTTKSDSKNVLIKIKDTGIGIAKGDLPHIFDRFYRVDQSRSKAKVAGFGLGLSLAKRIIEVHKGKVEVSSVVGKGTTFSIKLPLRHS